MYHYININILLQLILQVATKSYYFLHFIFASSACYESLNPLLLLKIWKYMYMLLYFRNLSTILRKKSCNL